MTRRSDDDRPLTPREKAEMYIDEVAERFADSSRGRLHESAEDMAKTVLKDPRFSDLARQILLEQACYERIRKSFQRRNSAIWRKNEEGEAKSYARIKSSARAGAKFYYMQYALMGGLPLGEATVSDLKRNAEFQDKQARRMFQTSTWLGMIADRMPDDNKTKVKQVHTEESLEELMRLVKEEYGVSKTDAKASETA